MAESESPKSFKDTLNLPRTEFPIRPNHKENDAKILERWHEEDLYRKAFECNEGNRYFILHDGPPYANGHLHLGHAYNKILKDIVTKSQRMQGKHVPVTPGWDCHGLPIELKVSKESPGLSSYDMKKACRAYANKWIDIQKDEFKKLGVIMDWDHPYTTMSSRYEAAILRAFGSFVRQGYVEKKNKTVPWCFSCQTVLAAAEIEYRDRKDPSVYVYTPLTEDSIKKAVPELAGKPVHVLIWTTTPWTLPLNRAVFLRPKTKYSVLAHEGDYFIIGSALADKVCHDIGIEKKLITEIDSEQLNGAVLQHPFVQGRTVPVFLNDAVSLDEGTACLHSAPGCGPEDYELGIRHDLEIFSPLAPDGTYTSGVEPKELEGMSIVDAQGFVMKTLAMAGRLLHKTSVRHSYPHCWRCRSGLMFRATSQWFCNLSQGDLKERALRAIDDVQFIPASSKNFLKATIQNRLEWCLSRQRVWGVPIPALLNKKTGEAFTNQELIEKVSASVHRYGIEFWDTVDLADLVPKELLEQGYTLDDFKKEQDILDVWFDSGVSHYAVLRDNPLLSYPADVYLEGVDQHRGWFQSSLLTSLVLSDTPCYRSVMTHGFTVDKDGRKMSKSLGNVVAPNKLIDALGTDGLRLWVSSISLEGDAIVSDVLIKNVQEVYRKIRNTCRFLLSNLYDFDHSNDLYAYEELRPIDRFALHELYSMNQRLRKAYDSYDFTAVFHAMGDYCTASLSSFYLDIIKDRLYVEQADGDKRRSAQTVCWYALDTLTRLVAPILSFTAEQLSDHYQKEKAKSIHLQSFAALPDRFFMEEKERQWQILKDVRAAVLKAIEGEREKGAVKHSLDARVTVNFDWSDNILKQLEQLVKSSHLTTKDFEALLQEWCIVSQVVIVDDIQDLSATGMPGVRVKVEPAHGEKCPRCWQWSTAKYEHNLCNRCHDVVAAVQDSQG